MEVASCTGKDMKERPNPLSGFLWKARVVLSGDNQKKDKTGAWEVERRQWMAELGRRFHVQP